MRNIGKIENEDLAYRFRDYLLAHGISCDTEKNRDGLWEIWIHNENLIDECLALFEQFKLNPDADFFKEIPTIKAVPKNQNNVRHVNFKDAPKTSTVTYILAGASILITALLLMEKLPNIVELMFYLPSPEDTNLFPALSECWRIITPMFIHFDIWHILFNMMWLMDFGPQLETKRGPVYFIIMVLVISVLSNAAQNFTGGPMFGGMSGVNYGLFGYIWMRTWRSKSCGLFIHKNNVWLLVGWFFACLFGIIPDVANAAHGAGLVIGIAWGLLDAWRFSRKN